MSETLETRRIDPKTGLEKEIAGLDPWFHNIHLPDGTETAPNHRLGDFPKFKWDEIKDHIPEDLEGWKILDIGCNAGFYSFELAKRGADVTGIDSNEHYLNQAKWTAEKLGLDDKTVFKKMQIYDLLREDKIKYDLIWFMGVFYHLRYPLLALDLLRRKAKKILLFQTLTMPFSEDEIVEDNISIDEREIMLKDGWAKMSFIENKLENDPTNWWAANDSAIKAMLRSSGFEVKKNIAHETYLCEISKTENEWLKNYIDRGIQICSRKK